MSKAGDEAFCREECPASSGPAPGCKSGQAPSDSGPAHRHTRQTRQRTMILDELRKCRSHPTAEEIYGRLRGFLPRISLGTVYRNLDLLARRGDIQRLPAGSGACRYDGNAARHPHVRCGVCGLVADIENPPPLPLPEDIECGGFTVLGARLEFDGLCPDCAARAKTKEKQ